ncbi:MAG TPA: DUF1015 domain-containing protein [Firmicutes bacterium]|nr:DUF1015 domain-containing protein [Bacillota bacterium]
MAKIVPIRGIRYNTAKAGSPERLITPPYDVIDAEGQKEYYAKSPYNIIRLEYGEVREHDDATDNRYTRARGFFTSWLREGILLPEEKPAVYFYEQEFQAEGRRFVRNGLFAGVGLEEYASGMILPHEETLSKAKADRLELMRHCEANFSPIFGLYDDPGLVMEALAAQYKKKQPALAFSDENGESHRLWVVSDEDALQRIKTFFAGHKIYLADGHHRYETALAFSREQKAAGRDNFDFCLMVLVNLHDPGLVIFPTHRLLKNVAGFEPESFLNSLREIFTVETVAAGTGRDILPLEFTLLQKYMAGYNAYLLYLGDNRFVRLRIPRRPEHPVMRKLYPAHSAQWRTLDVAVLQGLVLESILGIGSEARAGGDNLTYTRNTEEALAAVDAGTYQAAFFLNTTRVEEVIAVAAAGDKMPQKSTFFYPKLVTGLVINDFTRQ